MSFKGLADFLYFLEKNGELIKISHPVSTRLEITEITDRISKTVDGGKALLFENNGTRFPLLINAFGSEKRMALSLGYNNLEEIGQKLNNYLKIL